MRSVGPKAVAACAAGDGLGRKESRLEEHFGRLKGDAAILAAHDAGHGDRAGIVGDEQHVGVEFERLLVEEEDFFVLARNAGVDGAVELGVVKGVQRLAEFEHHVVGDVDQG